MLSRPPPPPRGVPQPSRADRTSNAYPAPRPGASARPPGEVSPRSPLLFGPRGRFPLQRTHARPPLPSAPGSRRLGPPRVPHRGEGWRPCRQTQMLEDGDHRVGLGHITQDPPPSSARAPEHIVQIHASDQRRRGVAREGLRHDARPETAPWPRFAPRTGRRGRSTLHGRVARRLARVRRGARALRSLPLPGLPNRRERSSAVPISSVSFVAVHPPPRAAEATSRQASDARKRPVSSRERFMMCLRS